MKKTGVAPKDHIHFLYFLASCSVTNEQRKAVLSKITPGQIRVLTEIFLNFRYGKIQVSDRDENSLRRKKKVIRKLTTRATTQADRKDIILNNFVLITKLLQTYLEYIVTKL